MNRSEYREISLSGFGHGSLNSLRDQFNLLYKLSIFVSSVVPSTPSPAGLYLRIHFTHQT
ncbi:hypothetical protein MICCA_2470012 [Microcystis aeruginosa PCC 9432]|uniref:Uncharacterized protein n=1 Tax=Microcystis aeruginosa PCC 9432 TaxID=1160280 RepID=A0A822L841_MICAE|nr:hypothetical protein MICCA_2470012 [Microcystis aeruginosa PCC 9432]